VMSLLDERETSRRLLQETNRIGKVASAVPMR
jgi:hypothetical protein